MVYLDVSRNVISDIKKNLPAEAGEFIEAVKIGLPGTYRTSICQRARQARRRWRLRPLGFPPYVAYLAFVRACCRNRW